AAAGDPACRRTARRYAAGVGLCQAAWVLLLAVPEGWYLWGWLLLWPAELAVPVWAERAGPTPWHASHIAERYGLFTIILWGYGHYIVFAAAAAVGAGIEVAVDHATGHAELARWQAGAALTVPVAVYLLAVWALFAPSKAPGLLRDFGAPVAALLILAATGLEEAPLATGAVCSVLLAAAVIHRACRPAPGDAGSS
ncbi:MAG: low temperature requirement protein A, partial [Acidimicrobiia bacterium]